jgi:glycosyltransferase involved in cell wall biosynthesis
MIGDGPERHALETRIKELDLCNAVHLMGWTSGDDVKTEILRSWALVLPSFAEGLPIVLMEALALCRPVISTWVAGIPELVENGINGWLIPPGSSGALADAMEQALKAPIVTLQQMGVHGRQKVLLNHNAKIQAGKLIALFEKSA